MKSIPYIKIHPKTSNTWYAQVRPIDQNYILDVCNKIGATSQHVGVFRQKNSKLNRQTPPHGVGYNTPETLCKGIIDNFNTNQTDFSAKQLPALEEVFRIAENELNDVEEIAFEEVTRLPKITVEDKESTFSDLFEIESIVTTTTLRRKK